VNSIYLYVIFSCRVIGYTIRNKLAYKRDIYEHAKLGDMSQWLARLTCNRWIHISRIFELN